MGFHIGTKWKGNIPLILLPSFLTYLYIWKHHRIGPDKDGSPTVESSSPETPVTPAGSARKVS